MSGARRVVLTGLGAVSPLGHDVPTMWRALVAGESGVRPITRFSSEGLGTSVVAEVCDFDPLDHADARTVRTSDPAAIYLLAAAREALAQAGLPGAADPTAMGVVAGLDVAHASVSRAVLGMERHGVLGVDAFAIVQGLPNAASALVAHTFGLRGAHYALSAACASGVVAILQASNLIRLGYVDAAVAGCASTLNRMVVRTCAAARVLTANPDAGSASRPFDAARDGFVIGEGSAALVLEDLDHARRRGARVLAELCGGWQTASIDGFTVNPAADAVACIEAALRAGRVARDEVDLVGAHATSTRVGDRQESEALHTVFAGRRVPAFAAKSALGHCMSAASGIETVALVLALRDGIAPPTLNQREPDPACDIDCVPNRARAVAARVALKNAFGLGGVNCCLVLRRAEPE
jgi:3-oxoacyl-[acyl-carrier-protein] synthase II